MLRLVCCFRYSWRVTRLIRAGPRRDWPRRKPFEAFRTKHPYHRLASFFHNPYTNNSPEGELEPKEMESVRVGGARFSDPHFHMQSVRTPPQSTDDHHHEDEVYIALDIALCLIGIDTGV